MSPTRRRRRSFRLPANEAGTVVLDADGLTKASGNTQAAGILRLLVAKGWDVATVAPVLVEALSGGRTDVAANRLIAAGVDVRPVDERVAREAAPLRARALRTANPSAVDALVATLAINTDPVAVILTSDPSDIEAILSGHPHVSVITV